MVNRCLFKQLFEGTAISVFTRYTRLKFGLKHSHVSRDIKGHTTHLYLESIRTIITEKQNEKGHCRPDVIMLWRIAALLRVEVGYFFPEDRFMSLTAEDRETLALLESFSPSALKYILAFIQIFGVHQQQRQFLTEDRLGFEPQTALLIGLELDLSTFEATLKQDTHGSLEALVRLTTLLVMTLDVTHNTAEMDDIMRRIAACSQRLKDDDHHPTAHG